MNNDINSVSKLGILSIRSHSDFYQCYRKCSCNKEDSNICKYCYFYNEEHDMGATIPYCRYSHKIIEEPVMDCTFYMNSIKASTSIRDIIKKELKNKVKKYNNKNGEMK